MNSAFTGSTIKAQVQIFMTKPVNYLSAGRYRWQNPLIEHLKTFKAKPIKLIKIKISFKNLSIQFGSEKVNVLFCWY